MPHRHYYRLVCSRALTDTKAFWNIHKTWAYLSVPVSGFFLRLILRKGQLSGWLEIAEFVVFGFVVSWVGSYLINLIRVPAILHREQFIEIASLHHENERLRQPRFTPQQERQLQSVRDALKHFDGPENAVLRYLLDYGPTSITHLKCFASLDQTAVANGIVKGRLSPPRLITNADGDDVQINPNLKWALAVIFNEPDRAIPLPNPTAPNSN